jgi:hypothetical protein
MRPVEPARRPGCLTALCGFLFLASAVWLFLAVSYGGDRGAWYPAHLVLQAGAAAAAAMGLWRMKRWGAVVFAATAAAVHLLYAFTGLLNLETLVIYAACLGTAFYYYRRLG